MALSAGDARPQAFRSPTLGYAQRISLPIYTTAGALVVTGTGSSSVSVDGGAPTTNIVPTYNGTEVSTCWTLDLTSAVMTGSKITGFITSDATNAVATPFVIYPTMLSPLEQHPIAGATSDTVVTLDSTSVAQDNYYRNCCVGIYSSSTAAQVGQLRKIVSYVGSTRVATLDMAWNTRPTTAATALYEILVPADASIRQGEVKFIGGQAVTAAAAVTVLASVGTAATSTAQTGDSFALLGTPTSTGPASIAHDIANISSAIVTGTPSNVVATAGALTRGTALTTALGTPGVASTYAATATTDSSYFAAKPTSAATVNGIALTGLWQQCTMLCGTSAASSVTVIGSFRAAAGRFANVYAYNYVTTAWDLISNSVNRLNTNATDLTYGPFYLLPAHQKNKVAGDGEVIIAFVSPSTTTSDILAIDYMHVAASTAAPTAAEIANAVKQNSLLMYYPSGVWLDSVSGTAGTVVGTNGTRTTPVTTLADAVTINASLNQTLYNNKANSTLTLDRNMDYCTLDGPGGWYLALGGQSINGTVIRNSEGITGVATSSTKECFLYDCQLGTSSWGEADFHRCHIISATITLTQDTSYLFDNCVWVPTAGTAPILDFNSSANARYVVMGNNTGMINVKNMKASNILMLDGDMDVTLDATCTAGTVYLSGNIRLTNSGSGQTLHQEGRMATDQTVGVNWANIINKTTTNALTNTTISGTSTLSMQDVRDAMAMPATAYVQSGSVDYAIGAAAMAVPGSTGGLADYSTLVAMMRSSGLLTHITVGGNATVNVGGSQVSIGSRFTVSDANYGKYPSYGNGVAGLLSGSKLYLWYTPAFKRWYITPVVGTIPTDDWYYQCTQVDELPFGNPSGWIAEGSTTGSFTSFDAITGTGAVALTANQHVIVDSGTVTTTTNLTNAPANGDLTAAMKQSVRDAMTLDSDATVVKGSIDYAVGAANATAPGMSTGLATTPKAGWSDSVTFSGNATINSVSIGTTYTLDGFLTGYPIYTNGTFHLWYWQASKLWLITPTVSVVPAHYWQYQATRDELPFGFVVPLSGDYLWTGFGTTGGYITGLEAIDNIGPQYSAF